MNSEEPNEWVDALLVKVGSTEDWAVTNIFPT